MNDTSWGDALSQAWSNFTGVSNEGLARTVRLLFFLIFILGALWSVYSYYQMRLLREEQDFVPATQPAEIVIDKKRLSKMISEIEEASRLRTNSMVQADSMRAMGKYVFNDPSLKTTGLEIVDLPSIPQMEIAVEPPPLITVRAIMMMGKDRVAIMDIDGVGRGMIVRPGDTFMRKKGRIVRIMADKVVVRWDGKTWNIAPGF